MAMKRARFKGELLPGHKGGAVEVPFDPAKRWAIAPKQLWRGRHGHSVHADLNGARFDTFIVPRSKKMWPLWNVLDTTPEGRGQDWYPPLNI